MELSELVARYDQRLAVGDYEDAATNGLQVGPRDSEVERVAFAVDAAVATIEDALEWGADLLVTHHGVVWGGIDAVTGREYERIQPLVDGECALYAVHLPLDGHPELGNAAQLGNRLGLENRAPFGEHAGEHLGIRATSPTGFTTGELVETLESELGPEDGVQVLDHGPETISDVAVLTGNGADWLREAEADGVDALITGEGKQQLYHEAREAGVSVFLAGHYATETLGVQALQSVATDWGLVTTFLDHPTGL